MDAFRLTVQQCKATMSTKKSRFPTDNWEDRYAVAINGDMQSSSVLEHLPCEISWVSFIFLEHDGTITGKATNRICYCHL